MDINKLKAAAGKARELVNALADDDVTGPCESVKVGARRCLDQPAQKKVPWLERKAVNLCRPCRAWWAVETANLALKSLVADEQQRAS